MKAMLVVGSALCALGVGAVVVNGCSSTRSYEVGEPTTGGGEETIEEHPIAAVGGTGSSNARAGWTFAVDPKPLSSAVQRGLDWIVKMQRDDGGWAQGEESMNMGGERGLDRSNVADTCISALALLRSGSTPAVGTYAQALARAAGFVCGEIEASDAESLYVTDVRNTRVQMKIGAYVDTFLASMLLAEIKGCMPDANANARVDAALAKVIDKLGRHQTAQGGWEGQGWAPVLSQSLGGKGLNRASQAGADFDLAVLERLEQRTASGPSTVGTAGVDLYGIAGTTGTAQDFVNTGYVKEQALREELVKTKDEGDKKRIESEIEKLGYARDAFEKQQESLVGRLDDASFVAGFGSNGGEEFLSYMNISESLVVRADEVWKRWDAAMEQNLSRVQNEDGSWTGHHCITGRNFCTASALLVLLADRAPVPVEVVKARG